MIADLDALNKSGEDSPSPDHLRGCWHENMLWFGPTGIGASFTIEGYQKQHQLPFRQNLGDKVYNGRTLPVLPKVTISAFLDGLI